MSFSRQTPYESTAQDKLMGVFLLLSIVIVVYAVIQARGLGAISDDKIRFYTILNQSYGMNLGASVTLSGVEIGKISEVSLDSTGNVRVSVVLEKQFQRFYTHGSKMKVNAGLDIGSVIKGTGLELIPGATGGQVLENDAILPAEVPKSVYELMEEWNIQNIAEQVQSIVTNLENLMATINDNQQTVVATLENANQLSASMAKMADTLPVLIENADQMVQKLDGTVGEIQGQFVDTSVLLQEVLSNGAELSGNLNETIVALQPTVDSAPILIQNLNQSSQQLSTLMGKLNRHWLLGGSGSGELPMFEPAYTGDDSLYRQEQWELEGPK